MRIDPTITASCLLVVASAAAHGDTIDLAGGGALTGQVARDASVDRRNLAVDVPFGRVVLDRDRVESTQEETPAEIEYRRRVPTVSDTIDAQLALAQWCRNNGLPDETRRHLRRVLDFDPHHPEARLLLGYQQVGGAWMTRDDVLASRGLVRWRGEYRTPQEVALLKQRRQNEESQASWRKKLKKLLVELQSADAETSRQALHELITIDEPQASAELIRSLDEIDSPRARRRLIEAIGSIGSPAGYDALLNTALKDSDPELRALATEQLRRANGPQLVSAVIGALRSNSNAIVNNAADVLLDLRAESATSALIDALVTTHRRRVGNNSDGTTYSFNAAAGQFGFGGGGPRTLENEAQNPRVLNALVELTGVNFLYDEERWRGWLESAQEGEFADLRRDI